MILGGRRIGYRNSMSNTCTDDIPENFILNMITLEWSSLNMRENDITGLYNFASCQVDDDIYIFGGSKVPFSQSKNLYRISYKEVKRADLSSKQLLKHHDINSDEHGLHYHKFNNRSFRQESGLTMSHISSIEKSHKPISQMSLRSKRVSTNYLLQKEFQKSGKVVDVNEMFQANRNGQKMPIPK